MYRVCLLHDCNYDCQFNLIQVNKIRLACDVNYYYGVLCQNVRPVHFESNCGQIPGLDLHHAFSDAILHAEDAALMSEFYPFFNS